MLFPHGPEILLKGGGEVAAQGVELRDGNEEGGAFVRQLAQREGRVAQLGERGPERGRHGVRILGGGEGSLDRGGRRERGPVGFGAGKGKRGSL